MIKSVGQHLGQRKQDKKPDLPEIPNPGQARRPQTRRGTSARHSTRGQAARHKPRTVGTYAMYKPMNMVVRLKLPSVARVTTPAVMMHIALHRFA